MIRKVILTSNKIVKIIFIFLLVMLLPKVKITKEESIVSNINLNKTVDLHAMALKINEIQMKDRYYVLDSYVGDLTAYLANCPLCGGTLGCTGQNVLDGTTTYNDSLYGNVNIVASSSNLPCGTIIQFYYPGTAEKRTAIVLDRGVVGNAIDLLVNNHEVAVNIGRRQISYDILRYGWERNNA